MITEVDVILFCITNNEQQCKEWQALKLDLGIKTHGIKEERDFKKGNLTDLVSSEHEEVVKAFWLNDGYNIKTVKKVVSENLLDSEQVIKYLNPLTPLLSARAFAAFELYKVSPFSEEFLQEFIVDDSFTVDDLKRIVTGLLNENNEIFISLDPEWEAKRKTVMVPNNKKIISIVEKFPHLLTSEMKTGFDFFKRHAECFEKFLSGEVKNYPSFPVQFKKAFHA